jgi:Ala-tRNA(Pro) deacylase
VDRQTGSKEDKEGSEGEVTAAQLPPPEVREQALYARLQALSISWRAFEHPPVFTVDEAARWHEAIPGGHTKNLFLKDKKAGLWLVVCRDSIRLDLNALARQLNAPRFSFGSGDLLIDVLGVPPGSVTPFALLNDKDARVTVVLDKGMLAMEPLNFHPLRNDRTIAVSSTDLLTFVHETGHRPIVVALPESGPDYRF